MTQTPAQIDPAQIQPASPEIAALSHAEARMYVRSGHGLRSRADRLDACVLAVAHQFHGGALTEQAARDRVLALATESRVIPDHVTNVVHNSLGRMVHLMADFHRLAEDWLVRRITGDVMDPDAQVRPQTSSFLNFDVILGGSSLSSWLRDGAGNAVRHRFYRDLSNRPLTNFAVTIEPDEASDHYEGIETALAYEDDPDSVRDAMRADLDVDVYAEAHERAKAKFAPVSALARQFGQATILRDVFGLRAAARPLRSHQRNALLALVTADPGAARNSLAAVRAGGTHPLAPLWLDWTLTDVERIRQISGSEKVATALAVEALASLPRPIANRVTAFETRMGRWAAAVDGGDHADGLDLAASFLEHEYTAETGGRRHSLTDSHTPRLPDWVDVVARLRASAADYPLPESDEDVREFLAMMLTDPPRLRASRRRSVDRPAEGVAAAA